MKHVYKAMESYLIIFCTPNRFFLTEIISKQTKSFYSKCKPTRHISVCIRIVFLYKYKPTRQINILYKPTRQIIIFIRKYLFVIKFKPTIQI